MRLDLWGEPREVGGEPIIDAVPSCGRGRDGDQARGSRHDLGSASAGPVRLGHCASARYRSQNRAQVPRARSGGAGVWPAAAAPPRIDPFGSYLRERATYLYVDQGRYWFSVQPSVTRTADDRASALEADDVWAELIKRLRADRERGPFAGEHVVPGSSGEVPDEMEARLVVLGPDYPHDTTGESKAKATADEILTRRGQQPRIFRNALLFLAPDPSSDAS